MEDRDQRVAFGPSWWRFDRYEVVDDTHIAPAPGAQLIRYDPFQQHEEYWGGRSRQGTPPYVALADVDPREPEEILEWCHRYGLLGILLHRTLEVRFWPRWGGRHKKVGGGSGVGALGGVGGSGGIRHQPTVEQEYYSWGAGSGSGSTWAPITASVPDDSAIRGSSDVEGPDEPVPTTPSKKGELLTRDELKVAHGRAFSDHRPVERPGARIRPIHSDEVRSVGLARGYAQFFPRYPLVSQWVDAYHEWPARPWQPGDHLWDRSEEGREDLVRLEQESYPEPYTEEFYRQYGEPIPLIQQYVRQVKAVYEVWQEVSELEGFEEAQRALQVQDPLVERESPFAEFQASLRGVSPRVSPEPDTEGDGFRWPVGWRIPSLYAGLSVMLLQDFGHRDASAKRCRECGSPFATTRTDKKYCSERCGNRYRVRKHRQGGDSESG